MTKTTCVFGGTFPNTFQAPPPPKKHKVKYSSM